MKRTYKLNAEIAIQKTILLTAMGVIVLNGLVPLDTIKKLGCNPHTVMYDNEDEDLTVEMYELV